MELETSVGNQSPRVDALDDGPRVLRLQPDEWPADLEHGFRTELDGTIHHGPALSCGERRNIGPRAGEIEPGRRTGAHQRRELATPHGLVVAVGVVVQEASVGSSPRASMRTP